MADHWKAIANALGAPGVDEPEAEAEALVPVAKPEPATKAQPAQMSKEPSNQSADREPHQRVQDTHSARGRGEPQTRGSLEDKQPEFVLDPHVPIPDEALSFKSTKSPRSTIHTSPAAGSFSEPPTPAPEARREAPRMPDRTESTPPPTAASPPQKPAKRKSSWESLANMFNIKVDRSKPAEEVYEQPAEPPVTATPSSHENDRPSRGGSARRGSDQQLSIFSGETSIEPNAALKSMFGDVPQVTNESWGKPRMVDDLGWDEEEKSSATSHSASKSSFQPEQPAADDVLGEETVRRGRRRRRGRRGRGDSLEAPVPAGDPTSHWDGVEEIASSDDDEWPEPESFETAETVVRTGRVEPELEPEFDAEIDELSSDGEPLRRSSRRRRRGRGRGREHEPAEGAEPIPRERQAPRSPVAPPAAIEEDDEDEDEDVVGFATEVDDEDDFGGDVVAEAPRRKAASDEESNARGRRRRRGRGGSGRGDEASREASSARPHGPREVQRAAVGRPVEDDDFDAELETEVGFEGEQDEVGGDGKHRNIPTWADSIESLVTTNLENRKRGDNRGAPRGRPKGRR